jgi:diguanylate cyclase (GGDEF)-like protein
MTPDPGGGLPPFAEALAMIRAEHQMTQDALATLIGVSPTSVRRWEHGEKVPSAENWALLKKALPELPPLPQQELDTQDLQARVRELEELTRRLEEQATIDPLTGVLNQRAVREALECKVDAAHRRGEPVAVLVLDLDKFKAINDTHGHPAGDEVLRAFAASVAGSIRKNDCFGRDGGEEFLLVYENTNLQSARILAERVRQRVEELEINGLRVTVSIGVAALQPQKGRLSDEQCKEICKQLVKHADQAAYWAKEDGRNRVDFWERGREEARAARKAREEADAAKRAQTLVVPPALLARSSLLAVARRSARFLKVPAFLAFLLLGSASFGGEGGCGGSGSTVICGPGTCNFDGRCVPCGSGPEPPDSH